MPARCFIHQLCELPGTEQSECRVLSEACWSPSRPFKGSESTTGSFFLFLDIWIVLLRLSYFFKTFFREKGKEGEREGEKHHCAATSSVPPTGDLARNPGMCPGWESNQRPFGLQAGTQSTEPQQPGRQPTFSQLTYTVVSVSGESTACWQTIIYNLQSDHPDTRYPSGSIHGYYNSIDYVPCAGLYILLTTLIMGSLYFMISFKNKRHKPPGIKSSPGTIKFSMITS